jgi:hypothetical protein
METITFLNSQINVIIVSFLFKVISNFYHYQHEKIRRNILSCRNNGMKRDFEFDYNVLFLTLK